MKKRTPVERRKTSRSLDLEDGPGFIEIEHFYGLRHRSIYQVVEHDEHGVSFLIPSEEGYFLPDTPLRFSIFKQDKFKTKHVGVVRYHHPVFGEKGEKYLQIGVEFRASLRHPPREKYKLRPPRLVSGRHQKFGLTFRCGDRSFRFSLADLSRYSAAFTCKARDLLTLSVSTVLTSVKITTGGRVIFEGEATVVRTAEEGDRSRVVIEPRLDTIDLDAVELYEMVDIATTGAHELVRRHDSFKVVDSAFKAMVADLRFFLEDFQAHIGSPMYKGERREPLDLLQEIFPLFYGQADSKITRLDDFVRDTDMVGNEAPLYKKYYQKNLLPLFLTAPYNHRVYYKPKGYPGDFEMMRMVHEDRFEGSTLFGKLVHKYSTNIPIARVVRMRNIYFRDILVEQLRGKPESKVLSVASGPALEFDLLLTEYPEATRGMSATLLDQEVEALHFSIDNLYRRRIEVESSARIDCLHLSLGNYLRSVARGKIEERYDLVYASGLFDYFDFKTSVSVLRRLRSLVNPGGRIIVANLSLEGNRHRTYMEYGHDWYLVYRTRAEMSQLAEALSGPLDSHVSELGDGLLKILEIKV